MDAHERADRSLLIQSADPLNAETAPATLIGSFVTPTRSLYIRSHGPIPALGADHAVEVSGLVARPSSWTRDALDGRFESHTVLAVMQCAGNRRADLQEVRQTSGDPWGVGAIGNIEWTGVRLADLLDAAGYDADRARHVRFLAADPVPVDGVIDRFGVSIPIAKALHPDTLVAWAMNGEPLLPEHGFPLRLVVPGYAGVRSPKWLTHIEVSDTPAQQPIQAKDYRLFPASVEKEDADWDAGMVIDAMPINAAICHPADHSVLDEGPVTVRGYAVASERRIARVDLSINGGRDWHVTMLEQRADSRWSCTRWQWEGDLAKVDHELVVRAIDETGQGQPSRADDVWNFAGYLATHWHRSHVRVS